MFWLLLILGIFILAAICACAFFLAAIWRSILGKSSIELKLNTTLALLAKKMESLDNGLAHSSDANTKLVTELREVKRAFEALTKNDDPAN